MPLTHRIGISTHFLPAAHGEDIWAAMQQVLESGLRGFELVPADYQGQLGNPYTIRNVGIWPRAFRREQRERMRGVFAQFDTVTIHSPHLGLNISSINPGIRDETARQYIECIQLAIDTGVRTVTFHWGSDTPGFISDPADIIRPMVRFGKLACEFADEHDLTLGYEVGGFEQLKRVIGEINHPRFGVNLDLGHAVMQGTTPRQWIAHFGEKIVEVHINGVLKDWSGFTEHQPVDRNNVIDYEDTVAALKEIGFAGPLQCELQGFDIADATKHALAARDRFNAIWSDLDAAGAAQVPDEAVEMDELAEEVEDVEETLAAVEMPEEAEEGSSEIEEV